MEMILVLVNCHSLEEARHIGDAALSTHLAACFDVVEQACSRYFWPPKSGKIEEGKGALLLLKTLEEKYESLQKIIEREHGDSVPCIGYVRMEGVPKAYRAWIQEEIK